MRAREVAWAWKGGRSGCVRPVVGPVHKSLKSLEPVWRDVVTEQDSTGAEVRARDVACPIQHSETLADGFVRASRGHSENVIRTIGVLEGDAVSRSRGFVRHPDLGDLI